MPSFIYRLEEMLLGGLLYAPQQLADLLHATTGNFGDPDHRAIFTAIVDAHLQEHDARGPDLFEHVAARVGEPAVSVSRLRSLALGCPNVFAIIEYGEMMQEAALRREIAESADRIAKLMRSMQPSRDSYSYTVLVDRLRDTVSYAGPDIDFNSEVEPFATNDVSRREELLLADLIQHPAVVGEVRSWLPLEVFSSPNRAEIFQAILAAHDHTTPEPGPTGIVAAEIDLLRAAVQTGNDPGDTSAARAADTEVVYLIYLASMSIEPGTSVGIGRDLLAEHVRCELATDIADRGLHIGADALAVTAEREERVRTAEAEIRYEAGLPPRDNPIDREVFGEWGELEAEHTLFAVRGRLNYPGKLTDERIRAMAERRIDSEDERNAPTAVRRDVGEEPSGTRQHALGPQPPPQQHLTHDPWSL
jgi:hypothetical protein